MEPKQIIIIGGGYAGLALGSYLQMNGYNTRILEKDANCGGISVSWQRGEYQFDGATNYLPGSSPDFNIHHILKEILDFNRIDFYDYPEFICVEHNNKTLHVYTDADRLQQEMLSLAPEDRVHIVRFIKAVKKFGQFDLPIDKAPEVFTLKDAIDYARRFFKLLLFKQKWAPITIDEYASRFKNRDLGEMFKQIFPHHEHFSVMAPMAPLGWMHWKRAGYPMGGSATIIKLALERYLSLGGIVETKKEVEEISVTDGQATGVKCIDGAFYKADIVASAADLHTTLFKLIGESKLDSKTINQFASMRRFSAIVQVSLGLSRSFDGEPEKLNTQLVANLAMGQTTLKDMMVRITGFDPSYAPKGKTSVVVQLRTEHPEYWIDLRAGDKAKYKDEKERVASIVIDSLEKRFGRISDTLEVLDVATPATYVRYTNLWKGAHQGWAPIPNQIGKLQKKTLPTVKSFYLTGQWLSPAGGIPAVIAMSRQVAQIICKKDKKTFSAWPC